MTTALHLRAAVTDSAAPTFRESLIKNKNVQFRLKICIVLHTYNTSQNAIYGIYFIYYILTLYIFNQTILNHNYFKLNNFFIKFSI